MTTSAIQSAHSPRLFVALALVVFALMLGRNVTRELDTDEHTFVSPSILTQRGLLPYQDYPYNHLPTQVYLFALLTSWTSYKLLAARVIATVCGTAMLLLLFSAGWRRLAGRTTGERWLLVGGPLVVFATCRFFTYTSGLSWNHDTSMLCCLGAYFLFLRGLRMDRLRWIAAAGFLVGAAVGIRMTFAFAFVPFALVLMLYQSPLTLRRRLAGLALATVAALVALTPVFVLWALAPERFVFGILEHPRLYTLSDGIHGSFLANLIAKLQKTAWRYVTDPANLCLLLGFTAAVVELIRKRALWRKTEHAPALLLAGGLVFVLWIGALAPTPQRIQYNFAVLPFMLLVLFHALALEGSEATATRKWKLAIGCAALIFGCIGLPRWYWGVVKLPHPERWATVQEHRRGEWLRDHAPRGGLVLTVSSIAPLEGGLNVYPEHMGGYFTLKLAACQSRAERKRTGMMAVEDLEEVLAQRPPDLVYCPPKSWFQNEIAAYAERHGYRSIAGPSDGYRVWVRPDGFVAAGLPACR